MEISIQDSNSLKLKGKHASLFVNPRDKTAAYNAAILIGNPTKSSLKIRDDIVVINGPGEYEAGGIKISGVRGDKNTVYTIYLDNLAILLGDRDSLNGLQQKLQEHDVAILYADGDGDVAFSTSLASKALVFFGEKGQEAVDKFAKDEKKVVSKYQITAERPPQETETILLS